VPFTFGSTVRTDLEPYHQAVVHFAAAELEKLRLNTEAVQIQTQLALGYVQRFLQTMQPKGGMQVRFGRNYLSEMRRRDAPMSSRFRIRGANEYPMRFACGHETRWRVNADTRRAVPVGRRASVRTFARAPRFTGAVTGPYAETKVVDPGIVR
jgi:hypothetical protein